MAVPKKKTSKSRRDKRRTHQTVSAPNLGVCPECGEPKRPHAACASCGMYKGRMVFANKEEL